MRRHKPRWTAAQIAYLGYLVGCGLTGPEIAEYLQVSVQTISDALRRYELRLTNRRDGSRVVPVLFSKEAMHAFELAAAERQVPRDALLSEFANTFGDEPELIDSVLDDGHAVPVEVPILPKVAAKKSGTVDPERAARLATKRERWRQRSIAITSARANWIA